MTLITNAESTVGEATSKGSLARVDPITGYIINIDQIRQSEYPQLQDTTYLDHAGTTLYARSLIDGFSKAMTGSLLGNPHSASTSSQLSSRLIDDTRVRVLRFFNADPRDFDVVFVANATAAIKLVADAFRDSGRGFRYSYHVDAHTSLVGVRELATLGSRCFHTDQDVENWLSEPPAKFDIREKPLQLFGYPGQSNMTGHRPPQTWCRKIRNLVTNSGLYVYTLFDAASLVSTSSLDLSDASAAPDFTALSFYKIFGFPNLGALIVRKETGNILLQRKYFGGGTVEMVGEKWYAAKESTLHSRLEDGTAPFHSILALSLAFSAHDSIYGSMGTISRHTSYLASKAHMALSSLRHWNSKIVCDIYGEPDGNDVKGRGPVLAFNLRNGDGKWVGKSEVEKIANVQNIQLRTGGLCNPGGIATHLGLSDEDLQRNFDSGQRCGDDHDVFNGKPTGVLRISFGAMSSLDDVEKFIAFIEEFFVDKQATQPARQLQTSNATSQPTFLIESLSIYPIKSCGSYSVPSETAWEVREAGLAYDREWCLIHQGTDSALSQKRYPRMALLRPIIDLKARTLQVIFISEDGFSKKLEIGLDNYEERRDTVSSCDRVADQTTRVCGDDVEVQIYTRSEVADFFTEALGVPCTLARCPPRSSNRVVLPRRPRSTFVGETPSLGKSVLLSNESPILLVSRSSVNRLNECIKAVGSVGKTVPAESFRGNIVIAEMLSGGKFESPYIEDSWSAVHIGDFNDFEVMGPCQRCQMVCVDQKNAQKRQEPFTTLAKTRRKDGKVWFGMHLCLDSREGDVAIPPKLRFIKVGDRVTAS